MQKKSSFNSASVSPRALVILFVCAAACLLVTRTLPAFLRSEAPPKLSKRTLSFAERVAHQRAIEDIYWRHRIWPKERPDPKPSLDAVMSQAQLEKKVADYLRKSQALEDYWQRPITAEQLQAEMDRMAQHTKQPEVLRELFEALGNDPFVITECLARPALAERLVTNWYAHDQRIHGKLRQRAEADLEAHNSIQQMKQFAGKYSEIELVKSDSSRDAANRAAEHGLPLNSREWAETVQKLAAMFRWREGGSLRTSRNVAKGASPATGTPITQIKTGVLSPLQEDQERYYVTAVIEKTEDHLRLATISWLKEPFESWSPRAENQVPNAMALSSGNYTLPTIADDGSCIDDTWTATAGPPDARQGHRAVWTGNEMIVWGGLNGVSFTNTGGRYNPSTDSWTATATNNAPAGRYRFTAVWSGTEMIIWGGNDNTGGRYNPGTDSWVGTTTTNAPTARQLHTAVWTGTEMIIWGGSGASGYLNTGGKYNPSTNSWTPTSIANAPDARTDHTAVWTGSEMIVWGGTAPLTFLNTGGRYNPITDSWTATSTTNAPDARQYHTAVWIGSEMIAWGGYNQFGVDVNTGGRYNPSTNSWTATSTTNAPDGREKHTAIWTGNEMIVWGGSTNFINRLNTGGKYDPSTDSWTATSTTNAPDARDSHTAVWTGSEMIVWGGYTSSAFGNTGGRYDPITDSWTNTGVNNAPDPRADHTAVWTGSEMIIWGGDNLINGTLYTGGRYNPAVDSWTATSTINAPDPRTFHTEIWTGSEMIVWGGQNLSGFLNTGGRYNPVTDSWAATSTTNPPSARYYHTAVWTGGDMIIWGGYDGSYLNTGATYNPDTDSWIATSITNAPDGRFRHTAVSTGSEMVVWGGFNSFLGEDTIQVRTVGSLPPPPTRPLPENSIPLCGRALK